MKHSSSLILLLLFLTASCAHGTWGKKAYTKLSWSHVRNSFVKNAESPHVWAPLGGAVLAKVSGWDHRMGEYAQKNTLFYHDQEQADEYSDSLNEILEAEMWASALFTNSREEDGSWGSYALNKAKGASVLYIAKGSANTVTKQLKYATNRERPNGTNHMSFPSGHSSKAGTYRMMIARNLESTDINPKAKLVINGATGLVTVASVWSRVGSNNHFPSDALAGYAIGSFVSGFIYDTLMNINPDETFTVGPTGGKGFVGQYSYRF